MSAVSPGRDGDGGQDWPGDVELDLLLLSAHASGQSALGEVIDTEQSLAAILARQETGERPVPQRPGGDQLPGPVASRAPPPPARPKQRDRKAAHHRRKKP